jgi:F0F1-type ATP synthase membrane subunit b/b'
MILNTTYEEEVNGVIVGRYMITADLRYEGRKQGSTIYAETESEVMRIAQDRISEIKKECVNAFADIYPNDSWEVRIYT